MNLLTLSLAAGFGIAAASSCAADSVAPANAETSSQSISSRNNPANQLVGVWTTSAAVQSCDSPNPLPPPSPNNVLTFHAGGTASELTLFPPTGVPNVYGVTGLNWRSNGTGVWDYLPSRHEYMLSLRFNWFVDGAYNGYQVVDRVMVMDDSGKHLSGQVQTTRYGADGKVIVTLCGTGISDRAF